MPEKRRTHRDPVTVRQFDTIDEYWSETGERRRYSIPHSDGSFFSDGSGYSNGPASDLHFEVIERMREVLARLEAIDRQALVAVRAQGKNDEFIPHITDIEDAVKLTQRGLQELDQEEVGEETLSRWLQVFQTLGTRFLSWSTHVAGQVVENMSIEAAKTAGPLIVNGGLLAGALYYSGVDFEGIAAAIAALILLKK